MHLRTITAWALIAAGFACILAGGAYHLFCRPEWTQAQAFWNLWYLWLAGVTLTIFGSSMQSRG
jgi:hypothetical protein